MNKFLLLSILLLANLVAAFAAGYPKTRPTEEGEPTRVKVSLYVIDIEKIDSKEQSFVLSVIIRLKWQDPRISMAKGPIPIDKIWQPNVQIYNLRDVETRYPEAAIILEDGTIQYTQRYYATLSSQMDLRDFPFDTQTLPITLFTFGYSPDDVKLEMEVAGGSEKFSISDWKIEKLGARESEMKINLFDNATEIIYRPRIDFEFKATRYIHFYLWKVLAPLMVILFLAWAVFWIDPAQVGAKIGVSGTSILTLIAFLYKLDNILPPVSYLTHLDHFIFTSLVLVFVAYLEALISTTYALREKRRFATTLDMVFRIGYPIALFMIVLFYWAR